MTGAIETTAAPATPAARRGIANDLKSYLDSPGVRAKLNEVAGNAMKPDDLIRLALMAASRSPDLVKCSRESILRSLLDAAALGIKPGGLMGRGYLVPRKNRQNNTLECCFDPGWRGLVDIARRSGQIKRIEAHVVYAMDEFYVQRTPLTSIRHVPSEEPNPGEVRAAYAVAEFQGGELQIEVMMRRDLEKIRKLGAQNGPWAQWYDEMARKSAVRRLCKYLPYDPQLDEAMRVMDQADGELDAPSHVVEETQATKPTAAQKLTAKLISRKASAQEGDAMLPPVEEEPAQPYVEHDPETGEVVPPEREPGEEG